MLKFCCLLVQSLHPGTISTNLDDLAKAEVLWVLESQRVLMSDKNFTQWEKQLNLFRDDNVIWRCVGHIQNANLPYAAKHPILLAMGHPISTLLVRRAHEKVFQSGVKATLTELRSQYWIVQGRSFVRELIRRCTVCKRFEGGAYHALNPPPLPLFRVDGALPFTYTGVDFAGPLFIKQVNATPNKVWICLLTCCVTRAVHLDLVNNLSTPSFIRCLKKFTAHRGVGIQSCSKDASLHC